MLENDPDFTSADVYITPPDEQGISEEDSDDEDQPVSLNHLSRQQLSAEADARIVRCTRRSARLSATVVTAESHDTTDKDEDDDIQLAELSAASLGNKTGKAKSKTKSKAGETVRKRKKEDLAADTGCSCSS
jgi:hypothetical protein